MSTASRSSIDLASSESALSLRIRVQCPVCERVLGALIGGGPRECSNCGFTIAQVNGIYCALAPDRREHFSRFISEYQAVRGKEGRGSASSEYYLALPFRDLSGHNSWQWSVRAQTFNHLLERILPRIEAEHPQGADILDVGAGNCWFSYRLALRGHRPVAVDLVVNEEDGLGAAHHYASRLKNLFPRFEAEMDRLPFAPCQFDAVVFNASLHYSANYLTTLSEAIRCLRRPGYLLVTDSPFYRRKQSGEQMVKEKRATFLQRFGFPSDSVESEEFFTRERLSELSQRLGLSWQIEKPWYGIRWAFRPVKAKFLGKREPAKFYLLWAKVER